MREHILTVLITCTFLGCTLDEQGTAALPPASGGAAGHKGGAAGYAGMGGFGTGGFGTGGLGGTLKESGVGGWGGSQPGDAEPEADALPLGCNDGEKNGSETDIDCGGGTCNPCANGKSCWANTDCSSDVCNALVCAIPQCNDGHKNGDETDQDCGGTCPKPCAVGKGCMVGADCVDGVCSTDTPQTCLQGNCADKVKNGSETDQDCGGLNCDPCEVGKACAGDSDCASNVCNATKCSWPTSCADIKIRTPSAASGFYTILPPGAPAATSTLCDMATDGGGWTLLMQCLPTDGCAADGLFLYGIDWLVADHGTGPGGSFALGQSLASLVQTGIHFMVSVSDDSTSTVGSAIYPLDTETRKFFSGTDYFASSDLPVAIIDSDKGFATRSMKICSAPGSAVRSLQGSPRLSFLGSTSGTPNPTPDAQCSFGTPDSQMLLQQTNPIASWGASAVASWGDLGVSHRVFVREAAPVAVSIVSGGVGKNWSDSTIGRTCLDYRGSTTGARTSAGAGDSGIYTIKPDPVRQAFETQCEMATDGGGWSLIQTTVWDWTSSSALDTPFAAFFSDFSGQPNEAWRVPGAFWPLLFAQGDILSVFYARMAIGASCSPLAYIGTGATMIVSQASKLVSIVGLSGSVPLLNGVTDLSTSDSGPASGCAHSGQSVPWFYSACCSTCPILGGGSWADTPHPSAAWLSCIADFNGETTYTACGGAELAIAQGHVGVNRMEFYFR